MKKLALLIPLIVWGLDLLGQDFSSDMARVNNMYIHLNKNMVVSTTTMLDKQLVSNQTISMSIIGVDEYFMKDAKTEVLVRDGLKILVSRGDNAIVVDSNYKEKMTQLPVSLFDTIKKGYSSIGRTVLGNGDIQYTLEPKTTNSTVLIVLEQNTLLIKRVRFESKAGSARSQSLELEYAYKPLGALPSISKYIHKSNGIYQLSQQWSGFTLLNYLPKPN